MKQQQGQQQKKGLVDIMFLIDSSGSMRSCFEGVKNHLDDFVDGLESNQQVQMDWRIGFISANAGYYKYINFTDSASEFIEMLNKVKCSKYDEFTLPALDFVSDFPWRHGVNKIVVIFSDEPIEGGYNPEYQLSKLQDLTGKLYSKRIMLFMVVPGGEGFERLSKVPRSVYKDLSDIGGNFDNVDFSALMKQMGKTISKSKTPVQNQQSSSKRKSYAPVYDIIYKNSIPDFNSIDDVIKLDIEQK